MNGGGGAITPGTISIKEDFNNLVPPISSANGLIGAYGWSTSVFPAGSGSFASVSGGVDLNHAGIVQVSAGAASGDTAVLYLVIQAQTIFHSQIQVLLLTGPLISYGNRGMLQSTIMESA